MQELFGAQQLLGCPGALGPQLILPRPIVKALARGWDLADEKHRRVAILVNLPDEDREPLALVLPEVADEFRPLLRKVRPSALERLLGVESIRGLDE
jgi:hypothetical protein